ncbi:hypothetical protein BDR04DRAFT_1150033 [Suillus decipiens]|nr:hypothetical protein BDR04DRAFT_1150033 [Suillus decipiens]
MQQHHINSVHIAWLDAIEAIPGFSGTPGCGNRQGGSTPSTSGILAHVDVAHEDEDEDEDNIAADDAWNEDMTHLTDVLEGIFMPAHQPTITPPPDQLTAASAHSFTSTHRSTNACEPSSTRHAITTAHIAQQSAIHHPSWIVTPPGSPSITVTGDVPPPAYYINPDVSFFNFMLPV